VDLHRYDAGTAQRLRCVSRVGPIRKDGRGGGVPWSSAWNRTEGPVLLRRGIGVASPLVLVYVVQVRQRCRTCFHAVFTMKTCASPLWGGVPFADAMERALWQLGYPNDFDTVAEAQAAVAHVLRLHPELRNVNLQFTEVA
jgi:hypothetical protein